MFTLNSRSAPFRFRTLSFRSVASPSVAAHGIDSNSKLFQRVPIAAAAAAAGQWQQLWAQRVDEGTMKSVTSGTTKTSRKHLQARKGEEELCPEIHLVVPAVSFAVEARLSKSDL